MPNHEQRVEIKTDGPVTIVTINRPEVRNAVDRPTAGALDKAFTDFEKNDSQTVAILTGSNGTFCSGADLKGIMEGRGNQVDALEAEKIVGSPGPMGPTRRLLSKPVIAAIEGFAVAGGLELALWCDLRVMAKDAKLGVFCRRWGVPLVDGGTIRLPRLIGHSRAMDLILTGREVDGAEALNIGLTNRLSEPGDALAVAFELARTLAALPQACLRSDRASAYSQWDSIDFGDALAFEAEVGIATIGSQETIEGATRFVNGAGRHGT